MWKILNVIAILIVGGAGYVAYLNRDALMQEKELLARAKGYQTRTEEWYRRAGNIMKERESTRDGLIAEVGEAETLLKNVETELEETKATLADVKEKITAKQEDLDAKKAEIAKFGGIKDAFEKAESLTTSIAELTESIAGMKQKNAADTASYKGTETKIQDYQNLELWQKTGKMKSLNANVVMVSPEFQFVIIDAGVGRGVVSRAKLDVFRGGSKIGELRVAVIEPTRSVCNIESIAGGETIQPGDRVVVSEESKPTDKDVAGAQEGGSSATPAVPAPAAASGTGMEVPAAATDDPFGGPAPAGGEDDPFGGVSTEGLDPGTDAEAPAAGDDAADPFGLN